MKQVLARLEMSSTADQNAQTSFRATCYTASTPCYPANASKLAAPGKALNEKQDCAREDRAALNDSADSVWTVIDLLHQMAFRAVLGV